MISALLVAIGVAAVFGGLRALGAAEAHARTAERLQRLAERKLDEMGTVTDPRTAEDSGNFADDGYPEIQWTMTLESSDDVNVDQITVEATVGDDRQSLTGLVFIAPQTAGTTP